jgi:hypothetical protein
MRLRNIAHFPDAVIGVAIHTLLQNTLLGPRTLNPFLAYEQALRELDLKQGDDPITQIIARKIIKIGQTGIRDPIEIAQLTISASRLNSGLSGGCRVMQ